MPQPTAHTDGATMQRLADATTALGLAHFRGRRKRPYSTAYTPRHGAGRTYLLKRVPATLWEAAQLKASRQGLSMRAAILGLLTDWTGHHGE
jgi:hypothetical protein